MKIFSPNTILEGCKTQKKSGIYSVKEKFFNKLITINHKLLVVERQVILTDGELSLLEKAHKEMKELGLTSFEEYLKYKSIKKHFGFS